MLYCVQLLLEMPGTLDFRALSLNMFECIKHAVILQANLTQVL